MRKYSSSFRFYLILFWTKIVLVWERLLELLFPAALFPAAFVAIALFGVFQSTGDPIRLLALVLTLAGFGWFFRLGVAKTKTAHKQAVRRRIEKDNALALGSLEALQDQPIASQKEDSQILWTEYQQRIRGHLGDLRPRLWHSVWASKDALALRILVFLALFSGFIIAGKSAEERLELAFYPGLLLGPTANVTVEAWINPPEYAGLPPMFLSEQTNQPIEVLAGSEFVVRVSNARRTPSISISGKQRIKKKLSKLSSGIFEAKLILGETSTIQLSRGAKEVWQVSKKDDLPPKIAFVGEIKANERDELAFRLVGSDDFGLEQLWLVLSTQAEGNFSKTDRVKLLLPKAKKLDEKMELDFTRHVFAGLPVQLRLEAIDGAGQTTFSPMVETILPQKLLIKPLAKAIAEQRLLIMRDTGFYVKTKPANELEPYYIDQDKLFLETPMNRLQQAPAKVQRAAALMRSIMRAPETGIEDPLVWIGLAYVHQRLLKAKNRSSLNDLNQDMWQIILQAEGGELDSALAAMRLAEKALQNALLLSASPSELQRLSQKYELAVKRYLQALAKAAIQDEAGEGANLASTMSGDQLQEMLDALQALAETGATQDARSLLKALAALLQNMKLQMMAGGSGGGPEDIIAQAMRKALEELGELLGEQKEVLDSIQQQANENETKGLSKGTPVPEADSIDEFNELADQQENMLERLQGLQSSGALENSEAASALKDAQIAMEETKRALEEGKSDPALNSGQKAFGQLRAGAEVLAQEMLDAAQDKQANGRDAFGRQNNGGGQSDEGTIIPDMINPERAREILNELRRRAREQQRPVEELEYLDRLLERF